MLVTYQLMWLAPGITIWVTADDVTELVDTVSVENPSDKPVTISYSIAGRVGTVVIPPGTTMVEVPNGGRKPRKGESVVLGGVV